MSEQTAPKKAGGKERVRIPEEQRARQNFPISAEIKTKRVYEAEPIDETCWAYMKLLRERDKTRKVYPVNPYAEVYQFRENMYGIITMSLDGMGDSWMYLIDGPEKAMLVDTSFGLGDLKGLVEEIVGKKELIVVNTHSHFDHAYGNAQFDKVYCHEYEAPVIAKQDEHIWDYLFEEGTGRGIWAEFDKNDIIPFKPYEVIGCPDGYTFDLGGGYEVELVHTGGHSAGHAAFLDKHNKLLIAGDDIISMRVGISGPRPGVEHGECATVRYMRECMAKLSERMDEFDHVFSGHFVTDYESSVIPAMVEACDKVLADPEHNYTFQRMRPGKPDMQYFMHVDGLGTLCYTLNSVG